MSKIAELDLCLDKYVTKISPENEEIIERWDEHPLAYYEERISVRAIGPEHNELVQAAIDEWGRQETSICHAMECSPATFDLAFNQARDAFVQLDKSVLRKAQRCGMRLHGLVRNISWAELFANTLPRSVPKDIVSEICRVGRQVVGVFYLEQIDRVVSAKSPGIMAATTFSRLDALWQRAATNHRADLLANPLSRSEYERICDRNAGTFYDRLY